MVLAGAVGIILPAALLGWVFVWPRFFPERCGEYTGCLGYLFAAWDPGPWVAVAAAWPLLYALRVRPAWIVAAIATPYLMAIWQYATAKDMWLFSLESLILVVFGGVIAYPSAVLTATTRMPWIWRALPAAFFAGLFVLGIVSSE